MRRLRPSDLSIVVLPFTNLSGDPAQDYFADGVRKISPPICLASGDSFVIARNTAFTFQGQEPIDAKEIGKELGVRYVLEGSVQREGNPRAGQRPAHRRAIRRASLGRTVSRRTWPTCSSCKIKVGGVIGPQSRLWL